MLRRFRKDGEAKPNGSKSKQSVLEIELEETEEQS